MAKDYPNDFARGYDYARRRYGELADSFGPQVLMDLAAALFNATGSNAELARGIATGIDEMTRAEKNGW